MTCPASGRTPATVSPQWGWRGRLWGIDGMVQVKQSIDDTGALANADILRSCDIPKGFDAAPAVCLQQQSLAGCCRAPTREIARPARHRLPAVRLRTSSAHPHPCARDGKSRSGSLDSRSELRAAYSLLAPGTSRRHAFATRRTLVLIGCATPWVEASHDSRRPAPPLHVLHGGLPSLGRFDTCRTQRGCFSKARLIIKLVNTSHARGRRRLCGGTLSFPLSTRSTGSRTRGTAARAACGIYSYLHHDMMPGSRGPSLTQGNGFPARQEATDCIGGISQPSGYIGRGVRPFPSGRRVVPEERITGRARVPCRSR